MWCLSLVRGSWQSMLVNEMSSQATKTSTSVCVCSYLVLQASNQLSQPVDLSVQTLFPHLYCACNTQTNNTHNLNTRSQPVHWAAWAISAQRLHLLRRERGGVVFVLQLTNWHRAGTVQYLNDHTTWCYAIFALSSSLLCDFIYFSPSWIFHVKWEADK